MCFVGFAARRAEEGEVGTNRRRERRLPLLGMFRMWRAVCDAVSSSKLLPELRRGDERRRGMNVAEELALLKNVIAEIESLSAQRGEEDD